MNIESPTVPVNQSSNVVFEFLSKVDNFEKLMPDTISKFEVLDSEKFLFALKGMPEIILKKKDAVAPNKIVLGAAGGKLDFNLTAHISETGSESSDVKLTFDGDFNPMMAMMIKGPITKFIETLAQNVKTAI